MKTRPVFFGLILIISFLTGPASLSFAGNKGKADINTLTKSEKKQGWKLLFDGKSFTGWRGLGRDHVPNGTWVIEDGMIKKAKTTGIKNTPDGKPVEGGDLCTTEEFDNFELTFEWKINSAGNSGIKYNVSEEISAQNGSKYGALGFEYQILDDGHPSYKGKLIPSQFTGSLYDLIPPQNVVLKPIGEFNSSRIIFNGNHIEHWLNGKKVMEAELDSQAVINAYKESKFNKVNGFLNKKKAHIVLTNHSDESWFRNIKIRDLNK